MLTDDNKRDLVQIAMKVDIGEVSPAFLLHLFQYEALTETEMNEITDFWLEFNDMTRSVAHLIATEKARQVLERCYRKESAKCTIMTKMKRFGKVITNGLMMILSGGKG